MMITKAKFPAILIFILFPFYRMQAQTFTLDITVLNQPENKIILGSLKGDKFTPLDSADVTNKHALFKLPEMTETGMYRLIFGKTLYAKIMNESPQQLDFIFNREHLVFETDFNAPEESLLVVLSEENRIWSEFRQLEKQWLKTKKEMEMDLAQYHQDLLTGKISSVKGPELILAYHTLQTERDSWIVKQVSGNPDLYVTRLLSCLREPILDGALTPSKQREVWQNDFFNSVDFNDESLIRSNVLTNQVFRYLTSYNQPGLTKDQRETIYGEASDRILSYTIDNQSVHEFILDYLVHGFEILQMEKVITYLAEKYSGTTCQTDEKTTLERKLESRKMVPGTFVADFTLPDLNGDQVILSNITKNNTLLVFWASWCPHCAEMIPGITSWAKQHAENSGLVFISLDTSSVAWKKAVLKLGMDSWYNLCDFKEWDGPVTQTLNIYATPTMILLGKDRKILATPLTINELNSYSTENK